jgi:hypothetical protein
MAFELAVVAAAPAHVDRATRLVRVHCEVIFPIAENEAKGIRDNVAEVFEFEHGGHFRLLLVTSVEALTGKVDRALGRRCVFEFGKAFLAEKMTGGRHKDELPSTVAADGLGTGMRTHVVGPFFKEAALERASEVADASNHSPQLGFAYRPISLQRKSFVTKPLSYFRAAAYSPFHCGGRFSAKARGPSIKSALLNMAAMAG